MKSTSSTMASLVLFLKVFGKGSKNRRARWNLTATFTGGNKPVYEYKPLDVNSGRKPVRGHLLTPSRDMEVIGKWKNGLFSKAASSICYPLVNERLDDSKSITAMSSSRELCHLQIGLVYHDPELSLSTETYEGKLTNGCNPRIRYTPDQVHHIVLNPAMHANVMRFLSRIRQEPERPRKYRPKYRIDRPNSLLRTHPTA